MKRETVRQRLAWQLRMLADRISPDTGPRAISHSFTFEKGRGVVLRKGEQQGCPLWVMAEDYHRAHGEADSEHAVVDWANVAADSRPYTRQAGGSR